MRSIVILCLFFDLVVFDAYANIIVNDLQSKANDEVKIDNDIKDMFTDENGNIISDARDIPSLVGESNGWKILTGRDNGIRICYAIKEPFSKIGNNTDDRTAYLMVVYYNKTRQNINISLGMNLKSNVPVNISVDGRQFTSDTNGSIAIPSPQIANQITKAMLYSKNLFVHGNSRINTYVVDSYDISDFKDIYYKLAENCDYM